MFGDFIIVNNKGTVIRNGKIYPEREYSLYKQSMLSFLPNINNNG